MKNPELLIVGNPPRKRRRKARRGCRRRRGAHAIMYRGKRLYYIQLIQKYGKGRARKIWKAKCRRKCLPGKRK